MEKYIHAFWHLENTDYRRLEKLWKYFGDFKIAWENAKQSDFLRAGLDNQYFLALDIMRKKLDFKNMMEKLWAADIVMIGRANPEFPEALKNIENSPFLLYRKGAKLNNLEKAVAIVGMRKSSIAGEKIAYNLGKNLARAGVPVISGLAFGIDAAAHSGAVAVEKPTIGVLASGIGKITPSSHFALAGRILACGGSIISEYPVTSEAFKQRFIERNRIIAGISRAVVVVEAGERSGALITANYALEQGKDLLAFPGDPGKVQSKGCNNLIKKGEAQLVDSIGEAMNFLGENFDQEKMITRMRLSEKEELVLNKLKAGRLPTQEIFEQLELSFADLLGILGKLEMVGLIFKSDALNWQISEQSNFIN